MKKIIFLIFLFLTVSANLVLAEWKLNPHTNKLDYYEKGGTASNVATDTTDFTKNLSSSDTDIQKALVTIDKLEITGAPTNATYLTSTANALLTNEVNLGLLSTGLLKGTVAGGVSTISSITDNSSNWNTAYGWGNHALAGYLTTETDPNALLTAGTDNVKDTHIDWGTNVSQVSADDIPDGATNAIITIAQETNFETAYTHSQTTTGNPHNLDYTDIGLSTNQVIDWTSASAGTIHATNYVDNNTTYTAGDHLTLTDTDFDVDDDFVLNTGDTITGALTINNNDGVDDENMLIVGDANDLDNATIWGSLAIGKLSPSYNLDVVGTGSFTDVVKGITPVANEDLTTKQYVDLAVSPLQLSQYFTSDTSDIGGIYYDMCIDLPVADTITSSSLGAGNDQALFNFASCSGEPALDRLVAGTYTSHIHIYKTGTKPVTVYYELYKRLGVAPFTETLLGTSATTGEIDASPAQIKNIQVVLSDEVSTNITDRVITKWYANVGATGTNVTINISIGGTNDSNFAINVNPLELKTIFVPYTGATKDVDLGSRELWTTGNVGIGTTSPLAKLEVANGATSAGVIAIREDSDDGTNNVTFTVPALAADVDYILPSALGVAGTVLTDAAGNGTLSWSVAGSGDMTKAVYDTNANNVVDSVDSYTETDTLQSVFDRGNDITQSTFNQWNWACSSATGTEDSALIFINDDRTGTTANEIGEATLRIDAEGTYALYIEDGYSYFNKAYFVNDVEIASDVDFGFGDGLASVIRWDSNGEEDQLLYINNNTFLFTYPYGNSPYNMTDHNNYVSPTFILTNQNGADTMDYAGVVIGERTQADVTTTHYFDLYAMTGSFDGSVDATTTEIPAMFRTGDSGTATSDHSLSSGDWLFEDDVEIDGMLWADGGITGDLTGNADTVTNATLTTALTVDTGTLTLTANAANNSVLTIGAGAVSVSGSNTGDVAETNSLETICTGIETTEIFVGNAPNAGIYTALSGDVTMDNTGAVTVSTAAACTGNSATVTNGVYTTDNISVMSATTSAQLYGVLSDETGTASGTPLAVFNQSPVIDGNIKNTPRHLIVNVANPNVRATADLQICLWPLTPAALTVTKIEVTLDATTNQVAGDLKYADTFIGLANAVVINDFDTTSGVRSDDTITSGAVAANKCMYLQFDSAPNAAITQMCIDVTFDYD